MRSQMLLGGRGICFALLSVTVVGLMVLGCASSFPGTYQSNFRDTGPKFTMSNGKIEHNLFDGTVRKVGKESWEDDWPG